MSAETQNAQDAENTEDIYRGLPGYHDDEENVPFPRSYIGWGPGDDYMNGKGWAENHAYDSWEEFYEGAKHWDRDLNLVADFYFGNTAQGPCPLCEGSGYNPATAEVERQFYDFEGTGTRWCDRITGDEVDALWDEERLQPYFRTKPTPEEVNAWERGRGLGHDAINRMYLVRARAKRLGVYGLCEQCHGEGSVKLPADRAALYLWVLHPRKGASKGITIREVRAVNLAEVKEFLRSMFRQHEAHFAWALAE